jgi:ABC-type transporter Mla subunit MlaD
MRMELEKAKEDKETKVAEITADRDATVAELTQSMKKAANDAAEVLQKTQEEAATKLAAVEADRDTQLATLKQTTEEAAKEAAELLQTTNDEANDFLSKQLETTKRQAEIAATAYEEQLSMSNKNIKNFQEYAEKMMEEKEAVEQSLEDINAVRIAILTCGLLFFESCFVPWKKYVVTHAFKNYLSFGCLRL